MKIEYACENDYKYIQDKDHHISKEMTCRKIRDKEIIVARDSDGSNIGWLRFGFFWDNTPFMNMLFVDEDHRGRGTGKELVLFFENEMKKKGYSTVMTSSQADEQAQHFYRKAGYKDTGCLVLDSQPVEIFFIKNI
jgi:ribosomal protein S18 acetylase RimI-like enzyme